MKQQHEITTSAPLLGKDGDVVAALSADDYASVIYGVILMLFGPA